MAQQHRSAGSYSAYDVHEYRAQLRMFVQGALTRTFERREEAETERIEAARTGLQALAGLPDPASSYGKDRRPDALPPRTYSPVLIREEQDEAPAASTLALAVVL